MIRALKKKDWVGPENFLPQEFQVTLLTSALLRVGHPDSEEGTRARMEYLSSAPRRASGAVFPCAQLARGLGRLLPGRNKRSQRGHRTTPGPPGSHPAPSRTHPGGRRKAGSRPPRAPRAPRTRPTEVRRPRGAPGLGGSGSSRAELRTLLRTSRVARWSAPQPEPRSFSRERGGKEWVATLPRPSPRFAHLP